MTSRKLLLLGCPRSGTNIVQKFIEIRDNIIGLGEPYNDPKRFGHTAIGSGKEAHNEINQKFYQWIKQKPTGIMKLLSPNLTSIDFNSTKRYLSID